MTLRRLIILVLTISTLTSCRHGYKVENGKVYYEYWHEGLGFKQGIRVIEEADAMSFKSLNFDCDCSFKFGKDKNHLFIDGELIKNIDPNTFTFIGNYIFRDKDSAYFFGFYNNLNDCVIKGVNPDKIELIKYPWSKAENLLINGRDTVYLEQISEFTPIDNDWGKTKTLIINRNKILYGADLESFKIISSYEGKDENYNYEFGFIARDDFKKTKFRDFDFEKENICKSGLIEFTDIYENEYKLPDLLNESSVVVEKLKSIGFTLVEKRQGKWSNGPRIVSYTLTNNKCDCFVDKLYHYDYSKPSETEKEYKVTERIVCKQAVKN